MTLRRLHLATPACLLTAIALFAAGCGKEEHAGQGKHEPVREGLDVEVAGIEYNVFITRQLNLKDANDRDLYQGPEPKKDFALYGVFLKACNVTDEPREAAEEFEIEDTQGNAFEPREEPEPEKGEESGPRNPFAYHAEEIQPGDCIPAEGSAADRGTTGGAMILFELPLPVTENRPLEFIIRQGGRRGTVELDI